MIRSFSILLGCVGLLSAGCATTSDSAPPPGTQLFNGKNLDGWSHFLDDPNVTMADVWRVEDGLLICRGEPMGYLCTNETFTNFRLLVEWRWAPGQEPGNSGVLMRITGEPQALPRCFEAQLQSGNAGDLWAFQGFALSKDNPRFRTVVHEELGRFVGVERLDTNEKPPGEWNTYDISVAGPDVVVTINGKKLNEATGLDVVAGKIGLQSEGGEIHFRRVELTPIE